MWRAVVVASALFCACSSSPTSPTPTPVPPPSAPQPSPITNATLSVSVETVVVGAASSFTIAATPPPDELDLIFGDGAQLVSDGPLTHTSHTYRAVGDYPVSAKAIYRVGGAAYATVMAHVTSVPPSPTPSPQPGPGPAPSGTLTLTAPSHVTAGQAVAFTASLKPNAGVTLRLDPGDGAGSVSVTTCCGVYTFIHTYTAVGSYHAVVMIAESGANASVDVSVDPVPPPPLPPAPVLKAMIACTPATPPAVSSCNITTMTYGGTPLGVSTLLFVDWDFGDGATLHAGAAVQHAYPTVGNYTVLASIAALTVDGQKNTTATTTIAVK